MKKRSIVTITLFMSILILLGTAQGYYSVSTIDKIRPQNNDLPSNFMYGKIPPFARKVLKANPWLLDRKAIKKLAGRIYPGGNHYVIKNIHMTIMTNKKNPYGDDIVCYIIVFHNSKAGRAEISKLKNFVGYNRDRAMAVIKKNMAVYIHADNVDDYPHIQRIAENIKDRLKKNQ